MNSNATDDLLILDGGLATELEQRGHDLNHFLWSARLLQRCPDEIVAVHRSYLEAGANCITTASYQASLPGFRKSGLGTDQSCELVQRSVQLARDARDQFLAAGGGAAPIYPLVAASVGPYGAFLADGSEYSGEYQLDAKQLREFHERRWQLLAEAEPDVLLCETIPSFQEVKVLASLSQDSPGIPTWISLSCRDPRSMSDGTPLEACVRFLDRQPLVAAIGVNCIAPQNANELVSRIRSCSGKTIVVYPNSGEAYNAGSKTWSGDRAEEEFASMARGWQERGASIIGGCCRTSPEHVRRLAQVFRS